MSRVWCAAILCCAAVAVAPDASVTAHAAGKLPQVGSSNFRLHTVRPPRAGARKRIVFQDSRPTRRSQPASYPWFWNEVDPGIAAADPMRLDTVLGDHSGRLSGRWTGFGSEAVAQQVLRDRSLALTQAASRENVSLALLLAVIGVESGGRANAVSHAGAQGLMQLMPATGRRFGVTNAFDPAQNIAGGAAYLNHLLSLFEDDALLALAAYNAGEGAVYKHKGVPPYAETRDYVPKVLANFHSLRQLCATPPRGPRDVCELRAELVSAPF